MGRFERLQGRGRAREVEAGASRADAATLRSSDVPREGIVAAVDAYYAIPGSWARKFAVAPRLWGNEFTWAPRALATAGTAIDAAAYFWQGMDPAQLVKTAFAYPLLHIILHLSADYLGPYSVHNEAGRHAREARAALHAGRFAEAGAGYHRAVEDLEWSRHAVEYGLMGAFAYLRLADDEAVGNRQRTLERRTQAADHLRLAARRSGLHEVQTDAAMLHFLSMSVAGAPLAECAEAYSSVPRSWPWERRLDLEAGTRRWLGRATFGAALGEAVTERLMAVVRGVGGAGSALRLPATTSMAASSATTSEPPLLIRAAHLVGQAQGAGRFWYGRRIRREAFAILGETTDRTAQQWAATAALMTHCRTSVAILRNAMLARTMSRLAATMGHPDDRLWYRVYAAVARHEAHLASRGDIYRAARVAGSDGTAIVKAGFRWIKKDAITISDVSFWARQYFDSAEQVDAELGALGPDDGV